MATSSGQPPLSGQLLERGNLDGKVALVTGASRGIGRAVARALASRGAAVAVHYHRDESAAASTLADLPGGGHARFAADLGSAEGPQTLVRAVVDRLGRLDVLVNNAGIYELHPPAETDFETWRDSWQRTLATNLTGPAHLAFLAARQMMETGGGRIIQITSRGAFRGEPDAPAYGASKAGLNAFSQSLAKALGPHGIYVYAVAPGWVETDMAAPYLHGPEGDAIRAQSPLGRAARPEEIADTVRFLAAGDAEYLTGAILDVNGASYLRT